MNRLIRAPLRSPVKASFIGEFDNEQIEQAHRVRVVLLEQIEKAAPNTGVSGLKDLAEAYAYLVNPASGHGVDVKVKSS